MITHKLGLKQTDNIEDMGLIGQVKVTNDSKRLREAIDSQVSRIFVKHIFDKAHLVPVPSAIDSHMKHEMAFVDSIVVDINCLEALQDQIKTVENMIKVYAIAELYKTGYAMGHCGNVGTYHIDSDLKVYAKVDNTRLFKMILV